MPKCDFLIIAGGTGGHVFPALSVALKLRYIGYRITWLGQANSLEEKVAHENKINFIASSSPRWHSSSLIAKLFVFLPLLKACQRSWGLLQDINPKVIIGFGGHVTVPIGIVGFLQKRQLLIHEQNVIPGKANKLLSFLANKVMVGMPTTFGGSKAIYVGNPVRSEIEDAAKQTKTKELSTPMKVLILGGSKGSASMNKIVVEAFKNIGQDFSIWHQTGKQNIAEIKALYQDLHKDFYVEEFIEDMAKAYEWADIVITRAGAITLAELLAFKKPSILIPNPRCANNHQVQNAFYLVEEQVASCFLENSPNVALEIGGKLMYWLANPQEYYKTCKKIAKLYIADSADNIVNICVKEYEGDMVEVCD